MKKALLFSLLFTASFSCLAQGTWVSKAIFGGTGRAACTGFSIGAKGYIGTGVGSNTLKTDFWEWDQSTNTWTQKADFAGGQKRCYAVGFSIGNRGYIGTGYDSVSNPTKDFWEYDPSSNIWTQKANVGGAARDCAIGFSIGNKGYIGTGDDNGNPNFNLFADIWEYDPGTNTWTQKANYGGGPRTNAVGFSIGNKGYIGTGSHDDMGHQTTDFWEFDPVTNAWTIQSNFGGGFRWLAVGFSIGNKGYIGTGEDLFHNLCNDFWEYDTALNTWTQMSNVPGPLIGAPTGFSIGNKGYLGTGFTATNEVRFFYEYTPSPASIEESFEISSNIFPNPFTSFATFELNKELKNAQLKLFDVLGKEVRSINFSGKQITLQREDLESGIYFYQISSENKIVSSGKLLAE